MGENLAVEAWSFLRISATLCCASFSDTKCCESHLSQDYWSFEGKKITENVSIPLKWKLAVLRVPVSSSFQLQSWDTFWFLSFLFASS